MSEPTPKLASDVRAFKGFIAIDNSHHTTKTLAINHSRELKIKAALTELANELYAGANSIENFPGFIDVGTTGVQIAGPGGLVELLMANRKEIFAAFNQDVRLRAAGPGTGKPRKPKTGAMASPELKPGASA